MGSGAGISFNGLTSQSGPLLHVGGCLYSTNGTILITNVTNATPPGGLVLATFNCSTAPHFAAVTVTTTNPCVAVASSSIQPTATELTVAFAITTLRCGSFLVIPPFLGMAVLAFMQSH